MAGAEAPTSPLPTEEDQILTKYGIAAATEVKVPVTWEHKTVSELRVFVHGNTTEPHAKIITIHEIGLNPRTCFSGMFNHPNARKILEKCAIYHICLPGQADHDGEHEFSSKEAMYPSMDNLGEWVGTVAKHFGITHFIAIGVGAGVNIFVRYLMHAKEGDPDMRGLVAISPMLHKAGWREWGFEKVARAEIRAGQKHLPSFIVNQNLHSFFGPMTREHHHEKIDLFRKYLSSSIRPANYRALLTSWTHRTDILPHLHQHPITVPTLVFYGGNSLRHDQIPEYVGGEKRVFHAEGEMDVVEEWKCADLIHEECTQDVLEAFRLFVQGFSLEV